MSSKVKTEKENVAKVSKKVKKEPAPEETVCVIRIRGAHGMNRKILNTLHLMNLYSVNSCTLLRTDASTRGMLQKAKDYIAYGTVSEESLKKLLAKRALLRGSKPLTDEHIRFSTVYKSIGDLAKALHEGKIRLKEVKDLKPVFRLHPPIGGFKGSIKKPIAAGGVLGNIGDKINVYLKKMI
ncbi:50S ribosomal protein L30 [Candidatus Lokiarchaeum ossiferum]|uniref:Large ribosomal subunit protein uL30 n=1 Tax=Candidatus Lokiarchaeum ossiferum TaxID=2951803 RepID=A0ABY6HWQ2_9ARCH|nr:50S ribosomal protein L30 [Candidatus Lokiarchaeum sp. B-35]